MPRRRGFRADLDPGHFAGESGKLLPRAERQGIPSVEIPREEGEWRSRLRGRRFPAGQSAEDLRTRVGSERSGQLQERSAVFRRIRRSRLGKGHFPRRMPRRSPGHPLGDAPGGDEPLAGTPGRARAGRPARGGRERPSLPPRPYEPGRGAARRTDARHPRHAGLPLRPRPIASASRRRGPPQTPSSPRRSVRRPPLSPRAGARRLPGRPAPGPPSRPGRAEMRARERRGSRAASRSPSLPRRKGRGRERRETKGGRRAGRGTRRARHPTALPGRPAGPGPDRAPIPLLPGGPR